MPVPKPELELLDFAENTNWLQFYQTVTIITMYRCQFQCVTLNRCPIQSCRRSEVSEGGRTFFSGIRNFIQTGIREILHFLLKFDKPTPSAPLFSIQLNLLFLV